MASLKDTAFGYEPQQTLNIADLDEVSLDLDIKEGKGKNSEGVEFTYKYFALNDKEYRVPNSVVEEIQTILKVKPDIEFIKVIKSGSGLATRYKVEVVNK